MVYIHADEERKLPYNFDSACALYGAVESVQDVRLTTLQEVRSGKFDRLIGKHLFVGTVTFMTEVFNRLGKHIPALANPFSESEIMPLSAVRERLRNEESWFIKPQQQKLFNGMVFNKAGLVQLAPYPDDTAVIVAKPFKTSIMSETRCYVWRSKIVDARNYAGDFRIIPDFAWADAIAANLQHTPCAYTLDIGVLATGENVVIELNDMWAIGNYGIDNNEYYRLLNDRYFEIMNSD